MKKRQMPFVLYNTLLCLLCAAIFVLGTLCVQSAEEKWYLKWDLSDDAVTQLSDYTLNKLSTLAQDVTIYPIHTYGSTDTLHDLQMETLLKMASLCPRVQVEIIDPQAQPHRLLDLAGDTSGIADGTVFVRNSENLRTVRIDAEEFLFARRIGEDEYTIYCGEAQLIGGIDRVVDQSPSAVWFISGHGEAEDSACAQLVLQLKALGLEIHTGILNMIQPAPGDILAMIGPQTDLTADETNVLKAHLNSGVHLLLACGADTPLGRLTNLNALCNLYGLGYQPGWVVENSSETARFVDRPEHLSPALSSVAVMDELPGRLILPRACALAEPSLRPGVTAHILLTTSDQAILKADSSADAYAANPVDVTSRFPMAILAESGDTKILQLSSVDMLLSTAQTTGSYVLDASENLAFLSACVEHMLGQSGGATLDAGVKQLPTQLITFDSAQTQQTVSLVLILALPLVLTLIMLLVVLRRRRM